MVSKNYPMAFFYFGIGALAFSGAYFGQGTGTAQYGNFLCTNESELLQCPHTAMTCSHTKDAGVRCRGKYDYQYNCNYGSKVFEPNSHF